VIGHFGRGLYEARSPSHSVGRSERHPCLRLPAWPTRGIVTINTRYLRVSHQITSTDSNVGDGRHAMQSSRGKFSGYESQIELTKSRAHCQQASARALRVDVLIPRRDSDGCSRPFAPCRRWGPGHQWHSDRRKMAEMAVNCGGLAGPQRKPRSDYASRRSRSWKSS